MNRRAVLGAALAPPCRSPAARARGVAGNLDLSRYPAGPLPPEFLTSWRAVHNHMLDDQPRLFLMHFWANGDAAKLAKRLRAALDQANGARS